MSMYFDLKNFKWDGLDLSTDGTMANICSKTLEGVINDYKYPFKYTFKTINK